MPTVLCALPASARYDAEAAERKADYLFLEAQRQKALEHTDLAYALLGRALELMPDKTGREAYERGMNDLLLAVMRRDSVGVMRSLELCEGYFNAHPDDIYAGASIAGIHAKNNRLDRALAIYDIIEREKPDDVEIIGNHADLLMHANRLDEAVGLYRKLEKRMGRNPEITQRVANIRMWQGDTVAAMAEIDDLIGALPRSVDALQLGASAALAFEMPARALDYVDRALQLDPSSGMSYYLAANAYQQLDRHDDYDRAIRGALMGDDLERDTKVELLRYMLSEGGDLHDGEFIARITPVMDSLAAQYPHDREIILIYMSFLIWQEKWADAAEQMERAIDIDPSDVNDHVMLAKIHASNDDKAAAVRTLAAAQERFPDSVELYTLEAAVRQSDAEYAAAADALNRALTIADLTDSDRSSIYQSLADLAQNSPEVGSPVELYEKALQLSPANDLAMNNYAYYLAKTGTSLTKARDMIARAVLYNPGSPTYYDTYAWVLFKLGEFDEARRYIDMALQAEGDEISADGGPMAEVLQHAGDIYSRLGLTDKAKEYWERARRIDPDIKSE